MIAQLISPFKKCYMYNFFKVRKYTDELEEEDYCEILQGELNTYEFYARRFNIIKVNE